VKAGKSSKNEPYQQATSSARFDRDAISSKKWSLPKDSQSEHSGSTPLQSVPPRIDATRSTSSCVRSSTGPSPAGSDSPARSLTETTVLTGHPGPFDSTVGASCRFAPLHQRCRCPPPSSGLRLVSSWSSHPVTCGSLACGCALRCHSPSPSPYGRRHIGSGGAGTRVGPCPAVRARRRRREPRIRVRARGRGGGAHDSGRHDPLVAGVGLRGGLAGNRVRGNPDGTRWLPTGHGAVSGGFAPATQIAGMLATSVQGLAAVALGGAAFAMGHAHLFADELWPARPIE